MDDLTGNSFLHPVLKSYRFNAYRNDDGQLNVNVNKVNLDNEWNAGHAAGAVRLGKGIIERDIESAVPKKDACLVLYCGGGYRSALAADVLQKMGYTQAISLDGGWRAYTDAGLPVER